ncbi:hypothetical protein GCM10010389_37270 [Streptomyces echinoruber]|uniref:Uncharacterized protein n=1 Tax=Streptomyces echinoruber TaxID=68898 RepID=A0A918RH70_9ACTN|nr:hypothetical protein GCM10010389_37270 [Streptomyces echinoruber]
MEINAPPAKGKCEACEDCRGKGEAAPLPGYPTRTATAPTRPLTCTHAPRVPDRCSSPRTTRPVTPEGRGS